MLAVLFGPWYALGATFGLQDAKKLLDFPWAGIIKLNQSEYLSLLHTDLTHTGVDSTMLFDQKHLKILQHPHTTFLITGKSDFIVSSKLYYEVTHLSSSATHLVGTGCALDSIYSAFSAIGLNSLDSTLSASITLSIATYKASLLTTSYGSYKMHLIINDRIDIAMLSNADGVHLGQSDPSVLEARSLLGLRHLPNLMLPH